MLYARITNWASNLIGFNDSILRSALRLATGSSVTLMEGGDNWVAFYANETSHNVEKNQGYMATYSLISRDSEYTVIGFDIEADDVYSKVIRTHDDMKAELDRLWPFYDSYGQRCLFEKLYAFLGEMPPKF